MDVREAYDTWAQQYDNDENKTRDLEGKAIRQKLKHYSFDKVLEIGCGTGKNTEWLVTKAQRVTAVDLSQEMLERAKAKIHSDTVIFKQADINKTWFFTEDTYDLITFSLILEHIENLASVFEKAASALRSGGYCYIGELHPFKQYSGTKARFNINDERKIVDCFNHNISDFVRSADLCGLSLIDIDEHFDFDDRNTLPRILTLIFIKL